MAINKTLTTATFCAAAALALTGCSENEGGSQSTGQAKNPASALPSKPANSLVGLTAMQIADKSIDLSKSAKSVRYKGTIADKGVPLGVDVTVDKARACKGTMARDGANVTLRKVGEDSYLKGDAAFWKQMGKEKGTPAAEADATAEVLKGRWLKTPKGMANGTEQVCDIDQAFREIEETTDLTRSADSSVNGQPVAVLTRTGGAGTKAALLYVAAKGKPYLLKATVGAGKGAVTLEFSEYDKPVTITAPPAGEVLDTE
ncbi:hypothetical protein [Streptomyces sp. SP18CS02]|uniref:hypothetical protein n=1 Tax=Streptomyces sp. SP18CS02 TaxID=3002531 RepID=UPI002E7A57F7|nr:hypothetical protein [Streptomyces sp. SP18CS02]MEE1751193.1 hypothetical protein [Streptomyces sp. SP18CS02]